MNDESPFSTDLPSDLRHPASDFTSSDYPLPTSGFRHLSPADIRAVMALYNESIDGTGEITFITEPVDADFFTRQLEVLAPREAMIVLTSDDPALLALLPAGHRACGIVAYGALKLWSDRAGYARSGETSIYVWKALHRRGIGTRMKDELVRLARGHGYHHLVAKVVATNASSVEYNLRYGYEMVGVQREIGYIGGKWYDVAIMQLILE